MADLSDLKQMVAANADVIESAIVLLNGLKEKLGSCTSQADIDDLKATLEAETNKLAEAVHKLQAVLIVVIIREQLAKQRTHLANEMQNLR